MSCFCNDFQGFLLNVTDSGEALAGQIMILLGFPMVLQRFREGAFGRADLLESSRPE